MTLASADDLPRIAPAMSPEEVSFLEAHLTRFDSVFEWGAGASTLWLAERVARVTSVEHDRRWAAALIAEAPSNVEVFYCPIEPGAHYQEGTDDDGDLRSFKRYTEAYTGKNVTVILIDGRARRWCARQVVECAEYGPSPGMRIFCHDADRAEVRCIWEPSDENPEPRLRLVEMVGRLAMLEPVFT